MKWPSVSIEGCLGNVLIIVTKGVCLFLIVHSFDILFRSNRSFILCLSGSEHYPFGNNLKHITWIQ